MALLNLSAPWVIFYCEVRALFAEDHEVHVVFDEENYHIKLYVDKGDKAEALSLLLPDHKVFGNITLKLSVVPANNGDGLFGDFSTAELYSIAFNDNGAFSFSKTITGIFANDLTYVVFKKRVVQYYNDSISDIYGQCSTLYQDIAKDVFVEASGVYYCTDNYEDFSDPNEGYNI